MDVDHTVHLKLFEHPFIDLQSRFSSDLGYVQRRRFFFHPPLYSRSQLAEYFVCLSSSLSHCIV